MNKKILLLIAFCVASGQLARAGDGSTFSVQCVISPDLENQIWNRTLAWKVLNHIFTDRTARWISPIWGKVTNGVASCPALPVGKKAVFESDFTIVNSKTYSVESIIDDVGSLQITNTDNNTVVLNMSVSRSQYLLRNLNLDAGHYKLRITDIDAGVAAGVIASIRDASSGAVVLNTRNSSNWSIEVNDI